MRKGLTPAIEHVTLCDVLWGRTFRMRAEAFLADALLVEALGAPSAVTDEMLSRAANAEWIAALSEQGRGAWGNRHNRCGSPEEQTADSRQQTADSPEESPASPARHL